MKPAPYCTPAMLAALKALCECKRPALYSQMWWELKSRGWMYAWGGITPAGVDYVNLRARLTQLKGTKNA